MTSSADQLLDRTEDELLAIIGGELIVASFDVESMQRKVALGRAYVEAASEQVVEAICGSAAVRDAGAGGTAVLAIAIENLLDSVAFPGAGAGAVLFARTGLEKLCNGD